MCARLKQRKVEYNVCHFRKFEIKGINNLKPSGLSSTECGLHGNQLKRLEMTTPIVFQKKYCESMSENKVVFKIRNRRHSKSCRSIQRIHLGIEGTTIFKLPQESRIFDFGTRASRKVKTYKCVANKFKMLALFVALNPLTLCHVIAHQILGALSCWRQIRGLIIILIIIS